MDKIDQTNQILKIQFLEIDPPINEIVKTKEEVNIIFQGNNNFYDFKKYYISKIPILIQLNRNKKSIIMTLLKSNNVLATGLLAIRVGEQNVIFNYEDKKKVKGVKAVNINKILDCIKLKIFCEFDNNVSKDNDKENNNKNINENKMNDSMNKYVPKVNLMKSNNNLKNKNSTLCKKIFEKKKKFLGNYFTNNNSKKNTLINNSQDFCLGGDYSTYLTEEVTNNIKQNNNINLNEIKKLNAYCSSKIKNNNNESRKTDYEMTAKSKNKLNKAKSKNYFSAIKKQYKSFGVMNNSTINLMNQNNKLAFNDNNENNDNNIINNNSITNRNVLKPTISFNKLSKRNTTNNKNMNLNKNLLTTLDNLISGQIVEHVDMSKKEIHRMNNNNNSGNKNLNHINHFSTIKNNRDNFNNNENKKKTFNNNNNNTINNTTMIGNKKNDYQFSLNNMHEHDEKNLYKNNNCVANTNRISNEKIQKKLSGNNISINNNNNSNRHQFNKSLCQQNFTDNILGGNDSNTKKKDNITINNINQSKSTYKLPKSNIINKENEENEEKINNNEEEKNENENDLNVQINNEEEENEEYEMDDDYTKMKEDFNLLYNDEYIKQITEDLLKLEVELFFEKMSELFSAYHIQMDEKILENQIIKKDYEKNIANYLLFLKLNNKLQFVKAQQHTKKCNLKEKGININKQNLENVNVNMNEINIFKMIFPNEDNFKKLKKIVSIILKKQGNKELLDEKYKFLIK